VRNSKPFDSLKIGVFGVNGIGQTHIRVLQALGANVVAVLASTQETAVSAAIEIENKYGHQVSGFASVDNMLAMGLDGVVISTPPGAHFDQLTQCIDKGLPVFCEKPFFWDSSCSSIAHVDELLMRLSEIGNAQVLVNTSNTVLVDSIAEVIPAADSLHSFSFHFYTNGNKTGVDIALDLLPHGLSLLLHIFGLRELTGFHLKPEDLGCNCSFTYGDCRVEFVFLEDPASPKHLSLSFNGKKFERLQIGSDKTYQVYMVDKSTNVRFSAEDPFVVYARRFLANCSGSIADLTDSFDLAAINMRMIAQCMEESSY
jgi:predicted dehydrogenase